MIINHRAAATQGQISAQVDDTEDSSQRGLSISDLFFSSLNCLNNKSKKIQLLVCISDVPVAERDEMKRKSVNEGESVTLDPGVMNNPKDLMTWLFNDSPINEIPEEPSNKTEPRCGEKNSLLTSPKGTSTTQNDSQSNDTTDGTSPNRNGPQSKDTADGMSSNQNDSQMKDSTDGTSPNHNDPQSKDSADGMSPNQNGPQSEDTTDGTSHNLSGIPYIDDPIENEAANIM
ncbi:hypothetical protein ROHU_027813 [Labeo rohita]|uniref:Uncharacterized protein n=1 Tax=Labeo rohita TaxID=84645 RepID=A0A498M5R7_LABRO|nr:hypothetical protein ROHU_027813 [Labeo rohita]